MESTWCYHRILIHNWYRVWGVGLQSTNQPHYYTHHESIAYCSCAQNSQSGWWRSKPTQLRIRCFATSKIRPFADSLSSLWSFFASSRVSNNFYSSLNKLWILKNIIMDRCIDLNKGPSTNYVTPILVIFDPLPPYVMKRNVSILPPPLLRNEFGVTPPPEIWIQSLRDHTIKE